MPYIEINNDPIVSYEYWKYIFFTEYWMIAYSLISHLISSNPYSIFRHFEKNNF